MTELEACIRLQTAFGVASPVPGRIAASVPSIAEFLTAGRTEWTLSGLLTAAQLDRLEHTDGRAAEQILHQCEYYGYGAVGISERAYPQRLRMIRNAPAVLYIHGTLPQMDREAAIAMVGTREATPTGARVAWQLAHDMARQGAVIVRWASTQRRIPARCVQAGARWRCWAVGFGPIICRKTRGCASRSPAPARW